MSMRNRMVMMAVLPAFVACASQSGSSSRPGPFSNTISREELQNAQVRNAYEAVLQLRPRWLQVRSQSISLATEVVVFQDRIFLGNPPDALERIGVDGIYSIEYVDGPTAQATLPQIRDRHVEGAIVVHMSPPTDGI